MGASKNKVSTTVSNGENNVPSADSTANALARDVIGNKLDTVSGDSLVAITKDTNTVTDEIKVVVDDTNTVVDEINERFHTSERWMGLHSTPVGEVTISRRLTGSDINPFVLAASGFVHQFGSWVQVLGSGDTPTFAGKTEFDIPRVLVAGSSLANDLYTIQIAVGESADLTAKLANNEYEEFIYQAPATANASGICDIGHKKYNSGTKVWMRTNGVATSTISLYYALREY